MPDDHHPPPTDGRSQHGLIGVPAWVVSVLILGVLLLGLIAVLIAIPPAQRPTLQAPVTSSTP